tara:strand:+ start:1969 stop:2304 length:336 start_codon:yes stop_codon:yes gene_type:complete
MKLTEEEKVLLAEGFEMEPIGTSIVVQRDKVELKSDSGIIMPDSVTAKKLNEGTVMAVGKGERSSSGHRLSLDVSVGDHVLWSEFTGNDIVRGDETYCILKETDILVILRD